MILILFLFWGVSFSLVAAKTLNITVNITGKNSPNCLQNASMLFPNKIIHKTNISDQLIMEIPESELIFSNEKLFEFCEISIKY